MRLPRRIKERNCNAHSTFSTGVSDTDAASASRVHPGVQLIQRGHGARAVASIGGSATPQCRVRDLRSVVFPIGGGVALGSVEILARPHGQQHPSSERGRADGREMLLPLAGGNSRDAKRIMASVGAAGLNAIDYLMITHFHSDHVGGATELARLIAIRSFIDNPRAARSRSGQMTSPRTRTRSGFG